MSYETNTSPTKSGSSRDSDLLSYVNQSANGVNQIAADLLLLVRSNSNINNESGYLSTIEQSILRSVNPIDVNEVDEVTVLGQRGVWVNKAEVNAWKGDIPIENYQIHEDSNPQVITKKVQQNVEYIQELAIRYLRPPTPPAPGEIVITQEANFSTGPAPPLIIRQQPPRPSTPEPLVVREAPPEPPLAIGPKRIIISGKRNPPPPRKVVIERLAPLPSKPQNVIIERWLPYNDTKRRVIFNKAPEVKVEVARPRNVIVQWEPPSVNIRKEIKYLGVIKANPHEYVQKYGNSLKVHTALPKFVLDIPTPENIGSLAANYEQKSVFELEGELEGFKYVNLDSEGLSEYRSQLLSAGIRDLGAGSASVSSFELGSVSPISSFSTERTITPAKASVSSTAIATAARQIFDLIDVDASGAITVEEAVKIVLKLNSQLKRSYGEDETISFFQSMSHGGNQISREQFVNAMEKFAA